MAYQVRELTVYLFHETDDAYHFRLGYDREMDREVHQVLSNPSPFMSSPGTRGGSATTTTTTTKWVQGRRASESGDDDDENERRAILSNELGRAKKNRRRQRRRSTEEATASSSSGRAVNTDSRSRTADVET